MLLKKLILSLVMAVGMYAQTTILPGDSCFSSSNVWPNPVVQWNPVFTCTKQLTAGYYDVTFTFKEPSGLPIGARVFTVATTVGTFTQTSQNIDIVKEVGNGVFTINSKVFNAYDTTVIFTFKASIRNAVVSSISITPVSLLNVTNVQNTYSLNGVIISGDNIKETQCPVGYTGPQSSPGMCLVYVPN